MNVTVNGPFPINCPFSVLLNSGRPELGLSDYPSPSIFSTHYRHSGNIGVQMNDRIPAWVPEW